jgi:long-chain acyl-CoA synthetase
MAVQTWSTESEDGGQDFADKLWTKLIGYGAAPFIEFEHRCYSGDEITGCIKRIAEALARAGVSPSEPVGMVVRNRVPHAAAVLGFIAARRPVAMIYSYQSAQSIARDIEQLRLAAVIVDRDDWTPTVAAAVTRAGSAAVVLAVHEPTVDLVAERDDGMRSGTSLELGGLHILTSGTTGPPRRVPVPTRVLQHTVLTMTVGHAPTPDDPPELVYWPFGSIGDASYSPHPTAGSEWCCWRSSPSMIGFERSRCIESDEPGCSPPSCACCLTLIFRKKTLHRSNTYRAARVRWSPSCARPSEQRYGIPLLWAYGATEFAGSVCAWTPELYRQYGTAKRDSVGRPLPGVDVRIVDESGAEMRPGETGLLEACVGVIGPGWIGTTDLASVDPDGFVTLHGRADGAINRGGFKILPETVRKVLVAHPAVRDACVVGVPDPRVGQVPFAAAEVQHGMPTPSEAELKEWVRESLPSHHIPVAICIVDTLPRNAALKVRPGEVAALYRAP